MSEATVTIIVALLSGSGLISGIFSIINTAILRRQNKGDRLSSIEKKVKTNEEDLARLQLLVMMTDYSDDITEILKIAQHYFLDLGGNFYMDTLFSAWLKKHKLDKPSWFANREKKED